MSSYDKLTTKEFRDIKDFFKKHGGDYPGAMKKFHRSLTTVRRIDLSPDWWEYRSHKGLGGLGKKSSPKEKIPFERIADKNLERRIRVLATAGTIKDLVIAGLIALGIIKLIGG